LRGLISNAAHGISVGRWGHRYLHGCSAAGQSTVYRPTRRCNQIVPRPLPAL